MREGGRGWQRSEGRDREGSETKEGERGRHKWRGKTATDVQGKEVRCEKKGEGGRGARGGIEKV